MQINTKQWFSSTPTLHKYIAKLKQRKYEWLLLCSQFLPCLLRSFILKRMYSKIWYCAWRCFPITMFSIQERPICMFINICIHWCSNHSKIFYLSLVSSIFLIFYFRLTNVLVSKDSWSSTLLVEVLDLDLLLFLWNVCLSITARNLSWSLPFTLLHRSEFVQEQISL